MTDFMHNPLGFPILLAAMLALTLSMLIFFRVKRWL